MPHLEAQVDALSRQLQEEHSLHEKEVAGFEERIEALMQVVNRSAEQSQGMDSLKRQVGGGGGESGGAGQGGAGEGGRVRRERQGEGSRGVEGGQVAGQGCGRGRRSTPSAHIPRNTHRATAAGIQTHTPRASKHNATPLLPPPAPPHPQVADHGVRHDELKLILADSTTRQLSSAGASASRLVARLQKEVLSGLMPGSIAAPKQSPLEAQIDTLR